MIIELHKMIETDELVEYEVIALYEKPSKEGKHISFDVKALFQFQKSKEKKFQVDMNRLEEFDLGIESLEEPYIEFITDKTDPLFLQNKRWVSWCYVRIFRYVEKGVYLNNSSHIS
jgi:hypothetical protein